MNEIKTFYVLILAGVVATAPAFAASSSDLQQRIERLERRVGHLSELTLEVEALKRDNRQLQGTVEEQQHALDNLRRKQRELYLDLDQRIGSGTPSLTAPIASEISPEAVAAPVRSAPTKSAPGDPAKMQASYTAAYNLLRPEQRRYSEAIVAFEKFLAQYPDSELTDNAQYWLGEANYVTQKNPAALAAFGRLVEQHPDSQKVPGAMLKMGYILDATGKRSEAKRYLERVLKEYPSSSAAGMARQRLNTMR